MTAERIVACPTCKGDSRYGPENPYRPFCSRRCQLTDLGAWADEAFRVPARPQESDDELGPPGATQPPRIQ